MNKCILIFIKEYITRVRKKSFLVATILGPLSLVLIMLLPTYIATLSGTDKKISIIDKAGFFKKKFTNTDELQFTFIESELEEAKSNLEKSDDYGLLYIPSIDIDNKKPHGITFYSTSKPSIKLLENIENTIELTIEEKKLIQSGISQGSLDSLEADIDISTISITEGEEQENSSLVATIVGYISSFLIYIFIFGYGTQIMRGVMDEKTNRVVEIIVSSVKPMELMMGKILGIGAVGMTQLALWIILTTTILGGVSFFFVTPTNPSKNQTELVSKSLDIPNPSITPPLPENNIVAEALSSINSVNIPLIVGLFLFYFLGGYLVYGALFAAIGASVDTEVDSQQFILPITSPLIISIMMIGKVLLDPHDSFAFWLSIIPFTSPIIMMMRIPFDVPTWEILLSMSLIILCFLFTTWIASKIYRIGILMYGTKINYKILFKWLFSKN
ncbi:MAG: ABC transporter permease [Chitinophagaceae bacterium]|nr:ABC transporter permease [Chitinophagaceae bacterium]